MRRWQVGEVTITKVVELDGRPSPASFLFKEVTPERVQQHRWLIPYFATEDGRLLASIHCLVIESQGKRIAVDTCIGNDKPRAVKAWDRLQTRFLQDLEAAGFPPESIDVVLCTHLHVDHVGWNTRWVDGRWVPTFARARYLFARREWEHWRAEPADPHGDVIGDSVRPVVEAGLVDLVEPDHRITDEVWLEPTPGHTPGHVSVHIASGGAQAVITGDLMHHPIQCCEPDLGSNFDVDAAQARATRREFLARYADRPVLVLGTHFAEPTGGHLVSKAGTWRFEVGQTPEPQR
jgi:glyoxylase-like metal-dependent hydrolase (beta-lactamase superfamily II)